MNAPSYASHWKRSPGRAVTAQRFDGSGPVTVGTHSELEEAIHHHDVAHPPKGWTWDKGLPHGAGCWVFGPWRAVPEDATENPWVTKWALYRSDKRISKKSFRSADRARHWAEIRLARSSGSLRGPKVRAGTNSTVTLPDVRVTTTERTAAVALAQDLDLTYSVLMRQLLVLARHLHSEDRLAFSNGSLILTDATP